MIHEKLTVDKGAIDKMCPSSIALCQLLCANPVNL
jgi:hypothetical protein